MYGNLEPFLNNVNDICGTAQGPRHQVICLMCPRTPTFVYPVDEHLSIKWAL